MSDKAAPQNASNEPDKPKGVKPYAVDPRDPGVSPAVHVAVQEMMKRGLNPADYRVSAMSAEPDLLIWFTDKNFPENPEIEGGRGRKPGFSVEIERATMKVKKAHFLR